MGALNARAVEELASVGLTEALWARANWMGSGVWHGDVCGCPDSGRCANGFHHQGEDDCGCLPSLIADWFNGDPYRFFAIKPPGPVCRIRRVGAYNRQAGRPAHCYAKEDGLTPRQRRRVRHKFNRTWF